MAIVSPTYQLSDEQWQQIEEVLPPNRKRGGQWKDHRLMVDAILWILSDGGRWRIENPAGAGNIDNILNEVEGIDIVMIASNDFGMFAGDRDGSPSYNAREKVVRNSVFTHGKILAGPSSWRNRPGYMLFQGPKTAKTTGYEKG